MEAYRYFIFFYSLMGLIQNTVPIDCPTEHDDMPWCGVNNTCPSTIPFLKVNGSMKVCVSACGPGEVLRDTFCIEVEKCERALVHDGYCLEMCPEGYVYFPFSELFKFPSVDKTRKGNDGSPVYKHTKGEEDRIRCQKLVYFVLAILVLFVGLILWSFFLYAFLHPRPFSNKTGSKCVRCWRQRRTFSPERIDTTAAAATDATVDAC